MSRKALRQQVVNLLRQPDYRGLVELAGQTGGLAELLVMFTYDPTDQLTWRAIEGLGAMAESYPELVKRIIPRLLYLLNEDSGSTGWGAAAALGEIGRRNLSLVADIIPMFCGFLENPFSRPGMLWGVGRLAQVNAEVLKETIPYVVACLKESDPQVQGLAAWCLGRLKVLEAREALTALQHNEQVLELYDHGALNRITVGQLVKEALDALPSA